MKDEADDILWDNLIHWGTIQSFTLTSLEKKLIYQKQESVDDFITYLHKVFK